MHMVWNINSNGDLYDNLYKDTQSHFTVLTYLKRKASLGLGFIWCVNKVSKIDKLSLCVHIEATATCATTRNLSMCVLNISIERIHQYKHNLSACINLYKTRIKMSKQEKQHL